MTPFERGCADALRFYKIAAETPEDSGLSKTQIGLMGAAAASPWAGMLGQQPLRHDPLQGAVGKNFSDLKELSRNAQPGDVLMTSKSKGSLFKNFITPAGDSQFYHAQPVTGRQGGKGYTLSAGDLYGDDLTPRQALDYDMLIHKHLAAPENQYSDAVLLRPKTPMSKSETSKLRSAYGARAQRYYDNDKAFNVFMRNTFVPKLDALKSLRPETVCEGNVCSTMPAMAMHEATGRSVVPGVAAQDVFPTDFLRSPEYELVGSHITPETRALEGRLLRKASPHLMRAGLGAGLAAGAYMATEDPAMAAGGVGAVLTHKALEHLSEAKPELGKYLPNAWTVGRDAIEGGLKTPEGRRRLAAMLGARLPATFAGGALAYGGAKALGRGFDALEAKAAREQAAQQP